MSLLEFYLTVEWRGHLKTEMAQTLPTIAQKAQKFKIILMWLVQSLILVLGTFQRLGRIHPI